MDGVMNEQLLTACAERLRMCRLDLQQAVKDEEAARQAFEAARAHRAVACHAGLEAEQALVRAATT